VLQEGLPVRGVGSFDNQAKRGIQPWERPNRDGEGL